MNNGTPIVSVVIPVYNAEVHFPACLASITAQTFDAWEAILVDDGSTDTSAALCDEAAAADPRFRVIHKENGGVSRARNDGIDAARGKYILFIDADDNVRPTYFERMVDTAERYGTDLVMSGYDRFIDDWESHINASIFPVALTQKIEDFLMLYTQPRTNLFGITIWAKMFRRDMLNEHNLRFDPEITYEEDCNFMVDCLAHLRTVAAVGEALYRYRLQRDSLSKRYRKNTFRFLVHGYRRRREILKEHGMESYYPGLKDIFYYVIKNTCQKIAYADLTRKERIAEYENLLSFPEVLDATDSPVVRKAHLTVRMNKALIRGDAKQLNRIMEVWLLKDKLLTEKKILKRKFNRLMKKLKLKK